MKAKAAQALVEYVIALVVMLAASSVAYHLIHASRAQAHRSQSLVGSEYP